MFQHLDSYWPWPLVFTALAVLVLVLVLRSLFRSALRQPEDLELDELPEPVTTFDFTRSRQLGASFRWALRQIERHGGGVRARYRVPWFLLFGQSGSRPAGLPSLTGLPSAFEVPSDGGVAESSGLSWSFFDHGVVLDLDGQYVLDSDGRSADSKGWREFLSQLERHRPERPLEGLVLTLSCADLLRGTAGVEEKTAQLSMRLRELSSELAINVPVYVLVTGCEQLPEFASFVRATGRSRSDLFGWSSPYRTDAAYRDAWIDEAYAQVNRDLQLAQIEILGGEASDRGLADDVALLPVALDGTRETLRAYLNGLFRSSAFQRGLIVRGIYFTGTTTPASDSSEAPVGYFLSDLFDAKIFPEYGLAQSEAKVWMTRNRSLRIYQVATVLTAVVLAFGMLAAHAGLQRRSSELYPFYDDVYRDLIKASEASDGAAVRPRAERLLDGMARLDFSRFGSFFLPSSWPWVDPLLEHFNRALEDSLTLCFDQIIFQALHKELSRRADHLSGPPPAFGSAASGSDPPVQALASLPAYGVWNDRVDGFLTLEVNVERYGQLVSHRAGSEVSSAPGQADLDAFSNLVEYLFDLRPPSGFFVKAGLYERALSQVSLDPFRIESYRPKATRGIEKLSEDFRQQLFRENGLVLALEAWEEGLVSSVESIGDTPEENLRVWRQLLEQIEQIERALSQPQILWAFNSGPYLGPEYDDLMERMLRVAFVESTLTGQIADAVAGDWLWHQQRLLASSSRFTGPVLARAGERPAPSLSGGAAQLRDALRLLLGQSFMNDEADTWFSLTIPPGTRLDWDVARLEQANALMADYEGFRESGLQLFPAAMRPEVSRMVRGQTAARLIDLTRQAQVFVSVQEAVTSQDVERQLRFEVASLAGAGQALDQLLSNLDNLGAFEAYWDLSSMLVLQGDRVLVRLDGLRDAARLYVPRDGGFSWWQGESPVSLAAFGVRDQAGLATYLNRQRARIDRLAAQFAGPTMTAVGPSRVDESASYRARAADWQAVIEQLGAYQNQTPGNSLAVLENLITLDMGAIGPDDCRSSQLAMATIDDFFLERANVLGSELLQRCEDLAGERAAERYGELASLFQQRLGNRFPFADGSASSTYPGVSPGDMRAFFALYDAYAASILAVPPANANFAGSGGAAHAFLRRLAEVREFFAFFLATPEPQAVPRYDFDVIFRVDRDAERGGNQIFSWRLDSGEQRFFAPNGSGRWTYGEDAITLELRWAQDSPRVPYLSEPAERVEMLDRVVTYRYDDEWSLLRFLLERRGPVPEPNPQTLSFEIHTQPSDNTAEEAPVDPLASVSPTVVFLRLRLKTPDAKNPQPVVLPPCFPTLAPALGSAPVADGCVALEVANPQVEPASEPSSGEATAADSGQESTDGDEQESTEAGAAQAAEAGESAS